VESQLGVIDPLLTLADVRPLIAGRPCEALARRVFPDAAGEMPAGSLVAV